MRPCEEFDEKGQKVTETHNSMVVALVISEHVQHTLSADNQITSAVHLHSNITIGNLILSACVCPATKPENYTCTLRQLNSEASSLML